MFSSFPFPGALCPDGRPLPSILCSSAAQQPQYHAMSNSMQGAFLSQPIPFLDLSLEFSTLFNSLFNFLSLPQHGGSDVNIRAPEDLNLCYLHAFVLGMTGCDLLLGSCNRTNSRFASTERDMRRIQLLGRPIRSRVY